MTENRKMSYNQHMGITDTMSKLMARVLIAYRSACLDENRYFAPEIIWDNQNLKYGFGTLDFAEARFLLNVVAKETLHFSCSPVEGGWEILLGVSGEE